MVCNRCILVVKQELEKSKITGLMPTDLKKSRAIARSPLDTVGKNQIDRTNASTTF